MANRKSIPAQIALLDFSFHCFSNPYPRAPQGGGRLDVEATYLLPDDITSFTN